MRRTNDDLCRLFEKAFAAERARVKGMPRRAVSMLTYLMQHDATVPAGPRVRTIAGFVYGDGATFGSGFSITKLKDGSVRSCASRLRPSPTFRPSP